MNMNINKILTSSLLSLGLTIGLTSNALAEEHGNHNGFGEHGGYHEQYNHGSENHNFENRNFGNHGFENHEGPRNYHNNSIRFNIGINVNNYPNYHRYREHGWYNNQWHRNFIYLNNSYGNFYGYWYPYNGVDVFVSSDNCSYWNGNEWLNFIDENGNVYCLDF